MSTEDYITELFCRVDDAMSDVAKHSQASLYPGDLVTLAILFSIKCVGNRTFYMWIERGYLSLFPLKKIAHRVWGYLQARLAYTVAAFNLLAQWHGLQPDERGRVHLSIAQFGL